MINLRISDITVDSFEITKYMFHANEHCIENIYEFDVNDNSRQTKEKVWVPNLLANAICRNNFYVIPS